jgi:sugar-specific transcriptional regulator TrmB
MQGVYRIVMSARGSPPKPIRFTPHALEQGTERGATKEEVIEAIRQGSREPAELGREMCRQNFQFKADWNGRYYAIKQVAPVIVETPKEIVVITVYTFYF